MSSSSPADGQRAGGAASDAWSPTPTDVAPQEAVHRGRAGSVRSAAVIGAGLAGLAAAQRLAAAGLDVVVYDKSRGPGGRTSTRRHGDWAFDHGAQYFTVRDERFAAQVADWRRRNVVAPWSGRIAEVDAGVMRAKLDGPERWVGVPGMNALCADLVGEQRVRWVTRVAPPVWVDGQWRLATEEGEALAEVDALVVSAPAPQSAVLLREASPDLASRAARVDMQPCWSLMVVFERPLHLLFDAVFVNAGALAWAASNSSKPGRGDAETWVLHATSAWTLEQLEAPADAVQGAMLGAFAAVVGRALPGSLHAAAHRWLYAFAERPLGEPCLVDAERRVVACGDWCIGPRVESAFLSGRSAGDAVLSMA